MVIRPLAPLKTPSQSVILVLGTRIHEFLVRALRCTNELVDGRAKHDHDEKRALRGVRARPRRGRPSWWSIRSARLRPGGAAGRWRGPPWRLRRSRTG